MYGIPLYIVQILMNFQNLCLNSVILEGGSFSFLKKLPQIKLILRNWEILVHIEKIICLNCKDGGRGQQELKLSQLKLSQLGLRGGRVKSIETLSQNMQFFLDASLIWECKFGVLSVSISTCKLVVPRVQIMSHLPKPARRLSALVEQEYLKQTGLGSSYFGSIYLGSVCFWVKIVWVKFWFDCNFLGQITLGQISVGSNFLFLGQISIWSNFLGWIFLGSNYLGPQKIGRFPTRGS